MKLSTIISFTALSATATMAFPLSPFRGLLPRADLEARDAYAHPPVRRSEAALSATATATESSASETASATETSSEAEATETASASEATATETAENTNTYLYSTITASDAMPTEASTRTLEPTTETASTTTETEAPEATNTSEVSSEENEISTSIERNRNDNNRNGNNRNDISQQIIIRVKEVIRIREVVVVERPVFVAVQVNVKVRQTIIVNQIRNQFISRFDNWDQNVVEQLGLIISQQFDILTRSRNSGFENFNNDQYNRFVSKFISQFQVFQSFQLIDIQQFVIVLKSFGINELSTFFGRSDSIFNQNTFNRFNVNNDFRVFVQQITVIIQSLSSSPFNSDDLFGLGSGSLIGGGNLIGV